MSFKVAFIFYIGVVLGHSLQDITPDDLRIFFKNIEKQVISLQYEAVIRIQRHLAPLESSIETARSAIAQDLINTAEPYWATIRSMEETAQEKGQDISQCLDIGNTALFALNSSILDPANAAFDKYEQTGTDLVNDSLSEADGVIQELNVLEEVVNLCSDQTCAASLEKTVTQYYERAQNSLEDAETRASNYESLYLPVLLAQYALNSALYVDKYTGFLETITTCINNL